jgi:hypothetical protein
VGWATALASVLYCHLQLCEQLACCCLCVFVHVFERCALACSNVVCYACNTKPVVQCSLVWLALWTV